MPNRRQILQAAAVASAASTLSGVGAAASANALPLYRVIYDQRFAPSRAFGQKALAMGASVRRISGDITPLWYDDLHARWRQSPAAVAGLTAWPALFCLEQLAWDAGMRVIYHAEHAPQDGGAALHRVVQGDARLGEPLNAAGVRWGEEAARMLLAWPEAEAPHASDAARTGMREARERDMTLVSWIIAPARRAGQARSA